jgi:hypothetical protein
MKKRKGPSVKDIAAGKREGLVFVRLEDMTDQEVRAQIQLLFSTGEMEHARELQEYLDAGRPPQELDRIQAAYMIGDEDLVLVGDMAHAALLAEAARLKTLASAATKPAATAEWKHATQLEKVAAWKLKVTPAAFYKIFGLARGLSSSGSPRGSSRGMKRDGVLEELTKRPDESDEQYVARLGRFMSRQGWS